MKKKYAAGWLIALLLLFVLPVTARAEGKINICAIVGTDDAKNSAVKVISILKENKLPGKRVNKAVSCYYDNAKRPTTRENIDKYLDSAFGSSRSGDVNYLYLAVHGYSGTDDNTKLLFANTGFILSGSSAYKYKDFVKKLTSYQGDFVVISDSCFGENLYTVGLAQYPDSKKRFSCFFSAKANTYAWGALGYQFYSSSLKDALTYKVKDRTYPADVNKDGFITMKELSSTLKSSNLFNIVGATAYGNTGRVIFQFGYVKLSKTSISIDLNDKNTYSLKSKASIHLATEKQKIKWKSSNNSVATVDKNGKVTAHKAGTATITAYLADENGTMCLGSEAKCTVKVEKPSLKISPQSMTVKIKGTKKITATVKGSSKKVTWTSSSKSVATVSDSGVVTGKKAGTAVVTAKLGKLKATCQVKVVKDDYKELYRKFLKSGKVKEGYYSFRPEYFTLLDIDKNGMPELIVTERNVSPYCKYHVYTVKQGKMKYLGMCAYRGMGSRPVVYYSSKYKGVMVEGWTSGVGGAWSALYGISGNKLVRRQHAEERHYPYDAYTVGTTDKISRKVSRSASVAFVKKYFKNTQKYPMKANTAANRAKL